MIKYLIRWGDYAGMTASGICLVHCLAMPFLLAAFPMLGVDHEHEALHSLLVLAVTIPVVVALLPGFLKHREPVALLLGATGLAAFIVAVYVVGPLFGQAAETALAICSSLLLIIAHRRNHGNCKSCA
ncbi:MAG: MerC domain-containing protein [Duganella sp.]